MHHTTQAAYLCIGFEREAGEVQGEIYEKMQGMEIEGGCNGRYLQTECRQELQCQ